MKEKTWKKMSMMEKIEYSNYTLVFYALYLIIASVYSFFNFWAALPCAVLAVGFAVQMEQIKTRKILLNEIRGRK